MEKYLKLQKYADKLIASHSITVKSSSKSKIIKHIALHFDAIIFNIISVFCLIAILNTPATETVSKITSKTIEVGKQYIDDTCKPKYGQTGGRLGSATFLGASEPMYSAANPTNDILQVNFSAGIARPQIGGGHKSSPELEKILGKYINDILGYHKVTAKKEIKKEIFTLIMINLECFISDLQHTDMITINSLKKIAHTHKILHPQK
jgi:hypothetical protein